ncbi:hypothetical protein CJI54_04750 [Bifidobacteriaceae bacterium NR026]|nr:hypothetical protein CJI54_04750 [Bifidobacteriaceae bacterium NR026]
MHDSSERRLCRECRHTYAKVIRALPAQVVIVRQIAYKQVRLTHLGHTPSRGVPPMPLNTRALKLIDRIHAQCCVVLGQVDSRYARLPLMPALRILGENVKRVPQLPAAVYDLREWRAIERDYEALTTPDEIKHPIGVCPKCNAPAAAHTWDKTYTCNHCGCSSIVADMVSEAKKALKNNRGGLGTSPKKVEKNRGHIYKPSCRA